MSKIIKYNEYINNDIYIKELIINTESKYKHHSDSQLVETDENYQKILNIKNIIPFLLERIDETNIWYSTLVKLTGVDHYKFIEKSSERNTFWKNWAKENGY